MIDQHPLTDKMILDIQDEIHDSIILGLDVETNPIRVGADWQLEKVIEWLKNNTDHYMCEDYYKTYFLTEAFLDDLKKAMRPTQEDN